MTKKEFKERADIHTYGRGKNTIHALFYDWNNDNTKGRIGYKYRITGYTTKSELFKDAYDILIKNITENLCWYDMKIAETDNDRFKVPIVYN